MTEENLRFLKSGHKNGGVDRSRTDLCDFADRCLTVWLPRLVCFLIYTNYCKCQGFFWKKTKTFQEKKAAAKFLGKFYDSRERFIHLLFPSFFRSMTPAAEGKGHASAMAFWGSRLVVLRRRRRLVAFRRGRRLVTARRRGRRRTAAVVVVVTSGNGKKDSHCQQKQGYGTDHKFHFCISLIKSFV